MIRRALKGVAFGLATLSVLPLIVLSWLERMLLRGGEWLFSTGAQLVALVPGPIGYYVRAAYYSATLESCSWEVHFGFGTLFMHRGASIARNVSTGAYCVIGHASIAAGVRMASRVSIPSGRRQHLDDGGALSDQTRFDRVDIDEGVWVGEGAIILANVGRRSIVSAGAVVLSDAPANVIVGGNPSKVLKSIAPSSAAAED